MTPPSQLIQKLCMRESQQGKNGKYDDHTIIITISSTRIHKWIRHRHFRHRRPLRDLHHGGL